jgi:hypothetical protein
MTKQEQAALMLPGYLLSEEGHEQLQHLRDELLLISHVAFAVTREEDDIPMEIRRSMLGQLLENYGLRLDDVLKMMQIVSRHALATAPRH